MFLLLKPERGHLSTTVYIIHIYMYPPPRPARKAFLSSLSFH